MVHIQGEDYFIDDAKVVAGDLVASNGIAHIIDKVVHSPAFQPPYFSSTISISLLPRYYQVTTPASQTFTGAAERSLSQISSTVTVVWSVAISLLLCHDYFGKTGGRMGRGIEKEGSSGLGSEPSCVRISLSKRATLRNHPHLHQTTTASTSTPILNVSFSLCFKGVYFLPRSL